MKQGRRQKQIFFEVRILFCVIITQLYDTKRMLEKSAHEAVVHGLCSGMMFKCIDKRFIFDKVHSDELLQIWIFYLLHQLHQFLIHLIKVAVTDRKIICRNIFTLICLARPLDAHLQGALKICHITGNKDVIQCLKFTDS